MSTDILASLVEISGGRNTSLFAVNNGQKKLEDLADYVSRVRFEKDLSQRDVEIKSGHSISKGYIGQIENRTVLGRSVTPQKLQALAKGLGVSEDEVFDVARGVNAAEPSTLEAEVGVLFYGWDDASDEDKKATIEAIKMIAEGFQRRRTRKKK